MKKQGNDEAGGVVLAEVISKPHRMTWGASQYTTCQKEVTNTSCVRLFGDGGWL